jgi:FkbM family methyltransferase
LAYYAASAGTLLRGVRNWPLLPLLAARVPITIALNDGLRFSVRTLLDMWVVKETCLDDGYACVGRVPTDGVVMDVGAGLGDFAIWSAHHLRPRAVHAFEPHPGSFALLQRNLALNHVAIVTAHRVALGAASGVGGLVPAAEPTQSRTTTADGVAAVPTPVWSLADAFDRCGVEVCHVLKMDIEGAEFAVLLDADAAVLSRVRHLRVEYHDGVETRSHPDLVRLLTGAGFVVRRVPSPVHPHLGILIADRGGSPR